MVSGEGTWGDSRELLQINRFMTHERIHEFRLAKIMRANFSLMDRERDVSKMISSFSFLLFYKSIPAAENCLPGRWIAYAYGIY